MNEGTVVMERGLSESYREENGIRTPLNFCVVSQATRAATDPEPSICLRLISVTINLCDV